MAQQQGSHARIILDTETTYGVQPVSPNAFVLPFVSESLRQSRNLVSSKTIRADRNPYSPVKGNAEVAGDVSFELSPQYGRVLQHTFGKVTTTGGSAPYTHKFTIDNLPEGIVFEKQFTDLAVPKYFRYHGCKINTFKLSAKAEGFVDCSISMMGQRESVSGESMDDTPTDLSHAPFDAMDATILEAGASLATVTEIDFSIENGLDGGNYVIDGTGRRKALPAGAVKITGNIRAVFEDMTLYNKALNNTETSLSIAFTKGTGTGASAGNEKFTLVVPELLFAPSAPVVSGPAGVVVELPFEGYYGNDVNGSAMYAVLLSPLTGAELGVV